MNQGGAIGSRVRLAGSQADQGRAQSGAEIPGKRVAQGVAADRDAHEPLGAAGERGQISAKDSAAPARPTVSMRAIPLTQGLFALVDAADYEALAPYKWSAVKSPTRRTWYAIRYGPRVGGRPTPRLMHRIITGAIDGQHVDHKDGNGLLNSRSNLRIATRAQNGANRTVVGRNNTSGYKGVCWDAGSARWRARVQPRGRCVQLGQFIDPIEAALAYDRAAIEIYGEFARTNFPVGTNKTADGANVSGLKAGLDTHA